MGIFNRKPKEKEEKPTWDNPEVEEFTLPDGQKIIVQICHECQGLGDVICYIKPNPYGLIRYTCPVCMGFRILKFKDDENQTWIPNT